jgi:Cu/Ag efflux pump CusA
MMLFGIGALRKMPVDVFPEFAPPRVQIQTACLGLTASEVEQLVTNPMEQAFYGIDGLDIVRSKSAPQLSALELIFKLGTDEMHARQLVQERLATIQNTLPTWAAPPVILQPLSATSRVLKIGITSDKVSLEDLSMQAYWTIRARLLRIPGVANIPMWGERIKAYQVEVDPGKLESAKVPLDTVMEVTSNAVDAGLLKDARDVDHRDRWVHRHPNQRLGIRHKLPIVTAEDLAQVPVATRREDAAHRRRRRSCRRHRRWPVTPSSTTAPAPLVVERCRGATPSTSRGTSRRPSRTCSPACPT